ncbi:MAG: prepilin-type N-terminal cleavage/methylation domain-containing protein [Planctomycetota bacterium]
MIRQPQSSRWRSAGHTLLEMMFSLVLLSIVMVSVGSAVMFASKAVPEDASAESSLLMDSDVVTRIAEDLMTALYVIERTSTAVTVVVPDRTGDGIPDRIRYAWSGTQGEPLFFQMNDGNAVQISNAVAVFDLSYTVESATQALPSALELSAEKEIDAFDSEISGTDIPVTTTTSLGQVVKPKLSNRAVGFIPTRLALFLSSESTKDGETAIAIKDWDGVNPGTSDYADIILFESTLPDTTAGWWTLALTAAGMVPADRDLAITAVYKAGSDDPVSLRSIDASGGLLGLGGGSGGQISTSDGFAWSIDSDATLAYRLYGQEIRADDDTYAVTREHLTAVDIILQSVADKRSPLKRKAVLFAAPPIPGGFATTGFSANPVGMDLDADTNLDWSHSSGTFSEGSLNNGVWTSDGELIYTLKDPTKKDVLRVEARMRANDTLGPTIQIPYPIDDGEDLLPVIVQLRDNQRGGQELVVYNDNRMETEVLTLSDLPSGMVDIELTLVPDKELISIEVNHQPIAAVKLEEIDNPDTLEPSVRFGSSGGISEFGSVEVMIGGTVSSSSSTTGGNIDLNVGGIGIELSMAE